MKRLSLSVSVACFTLASVACETSAPTHAVVDNDYTVEQDVTVYKAWWSVASIREHVSPGSESAPVRVVENTDYAFALLARGWDPEAGAPLALIPVHTRSPVTATRGETLHIHISPETVLGDCELGEPLSQGDANFIVNRLFPGDFTGLQYDAATCTSSPIDAGGEGGGGGAGGAGESAAANGGTGGVPE